MQRVEQQIFKPNTQLQLETDQTSADKVTGRSSNGSNGIKLSLEEQTQADEETVRNNEHMRLDETDEEN